jgi:hypothetical protein
VAEGRELQEWLLDVQGTELYAGERFTLRVRAACATNAAPQGL